MKRTIVAILDWLINWLENRNKLHRPPPTEEINKEFQEKVNRLLIYELAKRCHLPFGEGHNLIVSKKDFEHGSQIVLVNKTTMSAVHINQEQWEIFLKEFTENYSKLEKNYDPFAENNP